MTKTLNSEDQLKYIMIGFGKPGLYCTYVSHSDLCNKYYICVCVSYVTGFGKIGLNAASKVF